MADAGVTISLPHQQAIGHFLRAKRARLSPADVGLPGGIRRRTAGLRREEVASLASVGISWYTALEQGRDIRPSEGVLNSLANVLRLTTDERQHLFSLAGYNLIVVPSRDIEEIISPAIRQVLNALEPNPAYVLGLCWNYLAWNEPAEQLFSITTPQGHYGRNLLWQLFMNPEKRAFYVNWEKVAQNVVAEFRGEVEQYACDSFISGLIDDLKAESADFNRMWDQYNVQRTVIRRKDMLHPLAGNLSFDHTPLMLAEHPTLKMIIYTPTPETAAKVSLLREETGQQV